MRVAKVLSVLRTKRERIVRQIHDLEHSAEHPKLKLIRVVDEKRPPGRPKKNE
jgi:hypothetical protein